jgi:hypothetical protein
MGGCMGCHGNAQVTKGTDFSFILAGAGKTTKPDVGGPQNPMNLDKFIQLLLP